MSAPMISVLTPTRGRPELAARMYKSARDTASRPTQLQMLFYVDEDDLELMQYKTLSPPLGGLTVGVPVRVGSAWNQLMRKAQGDILMMGNDDLVFRTQGWDEMVREHVAQFQDEIYVAWCNDLSPKSAVRCAFPIVSRKWCNTLGYFAPECFNFLWHDTWVWDLGLRVGRTLYMGDAVVEHRHFAFKKAEYDATYRRHRVGPEQNVKRQADRQMFTATADTREQCAEMLREVMSS